MRDVFPHSSKHKSSSSSSSAMHYKSEKEKRKEKKHGKHKEDDREYMEKDSRQRYIKDEPLSPALPGEVIEIHGSSSEGEGSVGGSDDDDDERKKRRKEQKHKRRHNSEEENEEHSGRHRSRRKTSSEIKDANDLNHFKEPKRCIEHRKEREGRDARRDDVQRQIKRERQSSESNRPRSNDRREESRDRHSGGSGRVKRERESREGSRIHVKEETRGRHGGGDRNNGERRRRGRSQEEHEWGGSSSSAGPGDKQVPPGEKQKPNFALSGKLAEDTNMFNGVVIKYSEPPEARMPKRRWRLYPFKGDQGLPTLYIHRQSAYLLGRDRKVVDIPIDHPSCSKQHAALQYRLVTFQRSNGSSGKQIRLYIIDLESANGTFINNKPVESKKYVELMEKDVIKFGYSSREYVLLHEHSKGDDSSDQDDE